jgi:hypothetical protein
MFGVVNVCIQQLLVENASGSFRSTDSARGSGGKRHASFRVVTCWCVVQYSGICYALVAVNLH